MPILWVLAVTLALLLSYLTDSVSVLRFSDGNTERLVPLPEDSHYIYSYVNSVYETRVDERHVRIGDRIRVTGVRSADPRAVEYFRWPGEPLLVSGAYEQEAPPNYVAALNIRVTPRHEQRLAGDGWSIDLAELFGDGVVRVAPERIPVALALLLGWRP